MLGTAKAHFDEDICRARALVAHAVTVPAGVLSDDILRAGWMMAVGACDAYFSDAYADLTTRALRAKDLQPAVAIPDRLSNLKVPVTAVIRQATGGWRWRMAARELIEDQHVLSLERIRSLFNHFFRKGRKLLNQDTIGSWITHNSAKSRLFGVTATQYRAKDAAGRATARKDALEHLEEHYKQIFQRRHDCIHNCDRPKVAVQRIRHAAVRKTIDDVDFLVDRCHEGLLEEFPVYLTNLGFSPVTRNQVCT